MMNGQILTPWVYRRWKFEYPAELYPAIIERLRGLPARAEELAASIAPELASRAPAAANGGGGAGWSVQRHLGHIADLETLMAARLDAYERGDPALPPADMSNARTVEADHDARPLADVLARLRAARMKSIARLEAYPRDFFSRSAWHERLGVQKRVVDTCTFFADHDDHHLALAQMVRREVHNANRAQVFT